MLKSENPYSYYKGEALWYWTWHAQIVLPSVAPVLGTLRGTTQGVSWKRPYMAHCNWEVILHTKLSKTQHSPRHGGRCKRLSSGGRTLRLQKQNGGRDWSERQTNLSLQGKPLSWEKSTDRDLIPKVSWSICRYSAQRHSANRNGRDMSTLASKEQEGQNRQEEDGTFSTREERQVIYPPIKS